MAKILVVDDHVQISEMVGDWLTTENHAATVVHTGFEGWKLIQSNEFDLAILDWDLPDLNGIDILKKFREAGGTTPVIMLTGHKSVEDKELGLDVGADDYVTKPFHMKELCSRIRAVLRRSGAAAPPPKPIATSNEEVLKKADLLGTALAARYEFLESLGEGGFAVVFKARHPQLDRLVAIKMLKAAELSEQIIGRFEQEGRAISRLDHPNIITVHDYGVTERGQPFMVMEFIDGRALDAILTECDLLPVDKSLDILVPIASALAHAHGRGVLHRDIKPANIMLKEIPDSQPVPKILDFGLAKLMESAQKALKLTQVQQVIGSPPYMSPEQINSKPLDERSDVYSFGCVIFETVTGYCPHAGDTAMEIMAKHLQEPPFSFEEVHPELTYPEELRNLVGRMLEKDPAKRPQKMREVRDELEKLKNNLPSALTLSPES